MGFWPSLFGHVDRVIVGKACHIRTILSYVFVVMFFFSVSDTASKNNVQEMLQLRESNLKDFVV